MNSSGRVSWRGYVALSLFWLAALAGVLLFVRRPSAQPIEIVPPPSPMPSPTPLPTSTPGPLRVDVAGAVRQPQVVMVAAGSIVADAIAAAGGPAEDADLDRINKAIALQDGMQVYVPHVAETVTAPLPVAPLSAATHTALAPASRSGAAIPVGGSIDINTATLAELESLPSIGPVMAQLIVDGRPYGEVDDLLNVKGIGPATLAKIRDLVTVR